MKDINKLFNYITPAQKIATKTIVETLAPNVNNLINVCEISEKALCNHHEVRKTLKVLQVIELLEYEGLGSRGTAVKVLDIDTFNRLKTYFDL